MTFSWKFPIEFNRYANSVEMAEGKDAIRNSIKMLLSTVPGERYLEPNYGFDLSVLAFNTLGLSEKTKFKGDIKHAIESFEPRAKVDSLILENPNDNNGIVKIAIKYTIIEDNTQDELVIDYNSHM